MPSNCEPSRSVVSNTSTAAGHRGSYRGERSTAGARSSLLVDMFVPVLVAVHLAAHGGVEGLLDAARDGAGVPQLPVVDRADGHHLGGGARQEGLVRGVEVAAQQVVEAELDAQVAGDG